LDIVLVSSPGLLPKLTSGFHWYIFRGHGDPDENCFTLSRLVKPAYNISPHLDRKREIQIQNFVERFVVPLLAKWRLTRVCEIGASRGRSTELLAMLPTIAVTVIDSCLDCDLNERFASNSHVTVKKGISLEVLPELHDTFDCILIDGDHNWYTVYHELKMIYDRELLKRGGIVFLHDVEWPWGRRDMYYLTYAQILS
jgi:predicted O-methyltransferase YrrM